MNLEEKIKDILININKKCHEEEQKRDMLYFKNDMISNCEFFKSVGKIDIYCTMSILLTEALENGKQ